MPQLRATCNGLLPVSQSSHQNVLLLLPYKLMVGIGITSRVQALQTPNAIRTRMQPQSYQCTSGCS